MNRYRSHFRSTASKLFGRIGYYAAAYPLYHTVRKIWNTGGKYWGRTAQDTRPVRQSGMSHPVHQWSARPRRRFRRTNFRRTRRFRRKY